LFIVGAYSSIRAIVFWWVFGKDTKFRKNFGRWFLVIMVTGAMGVGIFMITRMYHTPAIILQSIALVFALGFVLGQYMPGKHPVRITVFLYAVCLLLTQTPINLVYGSGIERWNIMGILIESAKIASVFLFYGMYAYRGILAKKLLQIKELLACQMSKIKECSSAEEVAHIMPVEKLEKLAVKMVQYEISLLERDKMTNIVLCQNKSKAVMDDLKTVADVKLMLEKVVKLKMQRLDEHKDKIARV